MKPSEKGQQYYTEFSYLRTVRLYPLTQYDAKLMLPEQSKSTEDIQHPKYTDPITERFLRKKAQRIGGIQRMFQDFLHEPFELQDAEVMNIALPSSSGSHVEPISPVQQTSVDGQPPGGDC